MSDYDYDDYDYDSNEDVPDIPDLQPGASAVAPSKTKI